MTKAIARIRSLFRRLRWKLTLSYAAVTMGTLLIMELAAIAGGLGYVTLNSGISPHQLVDDLSTAYVPLVRPYLTQDPPNIDGLQKLLGQYRTNVIEAKPIDLGNLRLAMNVGNILNVYFVTDEGIVVDSLPHAILGETALGRPLDVVAIPGLGPHLGAALAGNQDTSLLASWLSGGRIAGAVPVFSETEPDKVVGAVAFTTDPRFWKIWPMQDMARQIGISLVFITLFAGLMGTIFGSRTAKRLVGRIRRLSRSTAAWSRGDFSVTVDDRAGDELGKLAHALNHMAQQLEQLLDQRLEMSILEERNRLARDLHDSAKQQAFAASAQLGAAHMLFSENPDAAETHLKEAEELVDEVRQELTHLIEELRPAAAQRADLVSAVREYALDWSNQSQIKASVYAQGERRLPLEVEQTLFRIVQEALSNIAKHSHAQHAEIRLVYNSTVITLTISDDGRGFDPNDRGPGIGLQSMRERAELLDGCVVIETELGKGTRVVVRCTG